MVMVQGLKINVSVKGDGKTPVILLHGWGQSMDSMQIIGDFLQRDFTVYNIDLPGFGLSDKPEFPFNTKDYADILYDIIKHFGIMHPIIVGHSFGGKIAIKYASLYDGVNKLVLVDSSGIVKRKKAAYYIKVYTYKIVKRLFSLPGLKKYRSKVLNKFGSSDYKNAEGVMKNTLVKVVKEDLRNDLPKIFCPVLLVWGRSDKVTPISSAYIMQKLLRDAGIVIIEGGGHFSYLDNTPLFLRVLDNFFQNDK